MSIQPVDFVKLMSPSLNARLLGGRFYYQHLASNLVSKFSDILDRPHHYFDVDHSGFCLSRLNLIARPLLSRARGLLSQLDNITTIQTHLSSDDRSFLTSSPVSHFSFPLRPRFKTAMSDGLAILGRANTRASIASRIHIELTDAYRTGKFIVFDTWTVDSAKYSSNIFISKDANGNRCVKMQNYLDSLRDKVLARANPGMTVRECRKLLNKHDYFQYFSVVERHKSGEFHCHVILILSHLPSSLCDVDPNRYRSVPSRRQLDHYPRWPYGFSTPIAVRFSSNDAYGRLGFKWPVKKGNPLSPSLPGQLANYLSKYISKQPAKGALYRCRMTRNFGIRTLIHYHMTLTIDQQMSLFLFPQTLNYHGKQISRRLVKESLLRSIRISLRHSVNTSLSDLSLISSSLSASHYPISMFKSLPRSMLTILLIKHLNFVDSLIKNLTLSDFSDSIYSSFQDIPRVSTGSLY